MDVLSVISFVVGIVSLVLGISALLQAKRYNDASAKLNIQTENILSDMQYMLAFNMRAVCEIQHYLHRKPYDDGHIQLAKDSVELHKLSAFSKENSNKVMDLLSKLSIKRRLLVDLQKFIESDEIDYSTNFFSSAETVDKSRIDVIVAELVKYGLLISIYYN